MRTKRRIGCFDRSRSVVPRLNFLVIGCTFFFSAAHDSFACERAALAGDDRALSFAAMPIVVNHHPIFGLFHFMSVRGVGEKRAVMALAAALLAVVLLRRVGVRAELEQ